MSAEGLQDGVTTRARSRERVTRGNWAQAGLVAARQSRDPAHRAALLDALGVTEALGLDLPVTEARGRYECGRLVRPDP